MARWTTSSTTRRVHTDSMDVTRALAAVVLAGLSTLLAVPAQADVSASAGVPARAAAPSGCAAQQSLEDSELVKKRPVRTRTGERFATLRFFAGRELGGPTDGSGIAFVPAYCLDLVVARAFADRSPRHRGRVSYDGSVTFFAGRATTGWLAGGGGDALPGSRVVVTYVVDGRTIRARRVMNVVYPREG